MDAAVSRVPVRSPILPGIAAEQCRGSASLGSRTLSRDEARRVYDRIGARQDSLAFYDDRSVDEFVAHADFAAARRVFEFGCGTGRLAARLLSEELPPSASYRGVDLSPTMIRLAQARLAAFAPRAEVALTDGEAPVREPARAYDRFVSSYVFDLLSEDDIAAVVREAHRMLEPGGLLCLAGLSRGTSSASRVVAGIWSRVHALRPALVGGCRPIDLVPFLSRSHWAVRHHAHLTPFALASEALVAERV